MLDNHPDAFHQKTVNHPGNHEASRGLDVDNILVAPLKTIEFDLPQFLEMFHNFLNTLSQQKRYKVTNGTQHLTRAFWKAFDEANGLNLFEKPTLNQRDIAQFHLLYSR